MKSSDDKEILKIWGDKLDKPYVCEDGQIVNMDLDTASRLTGIKLEDRSDGTIIIREKRRRRCIFCGGKKCMANPGYLEPPSLRYLDTDYEFIEIYSCRSKRFFGKKFMRFAGNINLRLDSLGTKKKYNICPACNSHKLVTLHKVYDCNKTRSVYRVKCKTCGFEGCRGIELQAKSLIRKS